MISTILTTPKPLILTCCMRDALKRKKLRRWSSVQAMLVRLEAPRYIKSTRTWSKWGRRQSKLNPSLMLIPMKLTKELWLGIEKKSNCQRTTWLTLQTHNLWITTLSYRLLQNNRILIRTNLNCLQRKRLSKANLMQISCRRSSRLLAVLACLGSSESENLRSGSSSKKSKLRTQNRRKF